MANSLLDFVMSLVRDPDAAAQYAANPAQTIADANLTDVTHADVDNLIPVVAESMSTPVPSTGVPAGADTLLDSAHNVWASGAATAAFDAFDDHLPIQGERRRRRSRAHGRQRHRAAGGFDADHRRPRLRRPERADGRRARRSTTCTWRPCTTRSTPRPRPSTASTTLRVRSTTIWTTRTTRDSTSSPDLGRTGPTPLATARPAMAALSSFRCRSARWHAATVPGPSPNPLTAPLGRPATARGSEGLRPRFRGSRRAHNVVNRSPEARRHDLTPDNRKALP